MEKSYRFAGVDVIVSVPDENDMKQEGTLGSFRVENVENPNEFQFNIVETLSEPLGKRVACYSGNQVYQSNNIKVRYCGAIEAGWEKSFLRIESTGNRSCVQVRRNACHGKIGSKTVLNALGIERLVLEAGGIVLHASFVSYAGKAILFTAPSGTGKSTQAELWKKYRGANIINGDRVAVRWDGKNILACGIPYAGSSQYCENVTLPIHAIVYLGQALETKVCPLTGFKAFRKVWEGCSVETWDKDMTEQASEIVLSIVNQVPVYHLACTADESAIIALENVLKISCES